MPRKLLFKKGAKSKAAPAGYKSLIIDDNEKIALVGTSSKSDSYLKDAKPTTLIADAEFYTWGTYSIYPTNYWTTFKIGDNSFHLVEMLTKLPTHDFFDSNLEADLVFGIFKENVSKLEFCSAFDPIKSIDINDYIENWRKVNDIVIPDGGTRGTGYVTSTNVSTSGGSGNGLKLDIEATDGEIMNWTINKPGSGYKVGDIVTVLTGDENCEMLIQFTSHNTYPIRAINAFDFIKTDTGLKMVNMVWDNEDANFWTNRYFDLDITLNERGSILSTTVSRFRNLNSPSNNSLAELNPGFTIGEFNYLANYCQQNFADPRLWYYTRTNDSTSQIDFCRYNLVTNTIEIILEDLRTWWDANADVPWEVNGIPLNIRGGILPHPDKPLLIGTHENGGSPLFDSYLIGPDTYHRFEDNKTTDYQTRLLTKNKMWIINPILP